MLQKFNPIFGIYTSRKQVSSISKYSKTDVECLGLDDKTAGFSLETDNLPPDCNKIIEFIIRKIN